MDKRSWPWKKKSSEKIKTTADQANTKTIRYVQISTESYAHLTGLEDQVKALKENLSSAQSEMTIKDDHVKQHSKVAEEAIAGWEKAEAETLALKNQLESVTLQKLTAEDRASHLDDALKECMKEIRMVKEESEQILHDTIFTKTKQWEKAKRELETKIDDLEQELLRSSAENSTLSRSLHERSSALMRVSDEKSHAEAEIEVLKSDIQSCEKEINSLKYEVHVVSKELEIRNEEKNMSVRLAESANKQHIEVVKKITKLEAECQRLRVLVRKKLPGPAALAQMKLEVDNLGRDYGETRARRSSTRSSGTYLALSPEFAFDNTQQCHKENEFLTAQLLAMEEETKMLKEALAKHSDLQPSRNIFSKMASKLQNTETHMLVMNQQRSPLKSNINSFERRLSHHQSNPSLTSVSEDGFDDEGSCSESWSASLISELSLSKKERSIDRSDRTANSKSIELMDDFLEMEKLAFLSTEANGTTAASHGVTDKISGNTSLDDVQMDGHKEKQIDMDQAGKFLPYNEKQTAEKFACSRNKDLRSKLHLRITSLFESQDLGVDVEKLIGGLRQVLQDTQDELHQCPAGFASVETHSTVDTSEQEHFPGDVGKAAVSGSSLKETSNLCTETNHMIDEGLKNAISQIHGFVVSLCGEAAGIQGRSSDDHVLREKMEEFSTSFKQIMCDEINLGVFIFSLSCILSATTNLRFSMLSDRGIESESSTDCIDKLTLLENRVAQHEVTRMKLSGECTHPPSSASDSDALHVPTNPGIEMKPASESFTLNEFEQMKLEKNQLEMDLTRCAETLERTKLQLVETEQYVAELRSQVAACQKTNSLADTQLKCMAESYNSLESSTQGLETEINLLRAKAEALDKELQEERRSHQDDLVKYKDLQDQIEREMRCSMCAIHSECDGDSKTQEREIAAAAEKLAECQETITLLSRKFRSLHPSSELIGSLLTDKLHMDDDLSESIPGPSGYNLRSILETQNMDPVTVESDDAASVIYREEEDEVPLDGYSSHYNASDLESIPDSRSKMQKQRSRSASSSSLSSMLNDKPGRGFSRFFFKGKKSDR